MNNLTSFFVPINDVIGYQPSKYIPGWEGSFKKIKSIMNKKKFN
jgi:hypothetical protein